MASSVAIVYFAILVMKTSSALHNPHHIVPKGRDYEAKVMIIHDNQPPLGLWNPKHGQPFPQPLGHQVTKQDIIDNITKSLLRRKMTPTEIDSERTKVNEAGLKAIQQQNNFREQKRQSAHQLLEEMRRTRARERKKQQELPLQQKKRQPQPKYQPLQRKKEQNQRFRPFRPMRGNRG